MPVPNGQDHLLNILKGKKKKKGTLISILLDDVADMIYAVIWNFCIFLCIFREYMLTDYIFHKSRALNFND